VKQKTVVSAVTLGLLGGAAGFLSILAAICLTLAVAEPGLESRLSIVVRSLAWLLLSLAGLALTAWITFRRGPRHWVTWLAVALVSLLICGYALVKLDARQRDSTWARLENLAEGLRALKGSSQLVLPDDRSLVIYRAQTAEGARLRITSGGFWLKNLFGFDPLQLDAVVVDLSPEGRVEAVRVDYF